MSLNLHNLHSVSSIKATAHQITASMNKSWSGYIRNVWKRNQVLNDQGFQDDIGFWCWEVHLPSLKYFFICKIVICSLRRSLRRAVLQVDWLSWSNHKKWLKCISCDALICAVCWFKPRANDSVILTAR